jgi:hypothetical protein
LAGTERKISLNGVFGSEYTPAQTTRRRHFPQCRLRIDQGKNVAVLAILDLDSGERRYRTTKVLAAKFETAIAEAGQS